jgi:hypothetical protein
MRVICPETLILSFGLESWLSSYMDASGISTGVGNTGSLAPNRISGNLSWPKTKQGMFRFGWNYRNLAGKF